jgi:hypothetical protein
LNRFVEAWNKHEYQDKYGGPDSVSFEDEVRILPKEKEMVKTSISINRHSLVDMALFGPKERVEALFRETRKTLVRLGTDAKSAKPLTSPPRGSGNWPNIHDVMRWLDSLTDKDNLTFLKRLHATLKPRVSRAVRREAV